MQRSRFTRTYRAVAIGGTSCCGPYDRAQTAANDRQRRLRLLEETVRVQRELYRRGETTAAAVRASEAELKEEMASP